MSRYRFLTEPRISNIQYYVTMISIVTAAVFFVAYLENKQHSAREARLKQYLADARAEIRGLKSAETKQNAPPLSTPASLKVSSETETQTPAVHAHDHSDVSTSDDTVEVVQAGPLKGLPLDVAKEIGEEYRVASMERATRYHEWNLRRKAHQARDKALFDKELAHKDAHLATSKKHGELILAVYARMSPEELEAAREEALKTQPAEVVDSFFKQVPAYGIVKSPEQIEQEAQDIEETQKTLAIERQELAAEREQIQREEEDLLRTKPPSPNIDLNEFYTEWKERNRSKPSP